MCFSEGGQIIGDYTKIKYQTGIVKDINRLMAKAENKGRFPVWLPFISSLVVRVDCVTS